MSQLRLEIIRKERLHMIKSTIKQSRGTLARSSTLGLIFALATVAISAATTAAAAVAPLTVVKHGDAPDLVLYNGKISTVDLNDSTVDAIAIRDGKILATGENGRILALAKQGT